MEKTLEILKPLRDELIKNVITVFTKNLDRDPRRNLYHYTDTEGLRGILESGGFWATNAHFLNDPNETTYSLELVQRFLAERLSATQGDEREILRQAYDLITNPPNHAERHISPYRHLFYVCFSMAGDVLSQWRAYADKGRGLALGFTGLELLKECSERIKDPDASDKPNWLMLNIHYRESEQLSILDELVEAAMRHWNSGKMESELREHLGDAREAYRASGVALAQYLIMAGLSFKRSGFSEEEEVRFYPSNFTEMASVETVLPVKARTSGSSLSTYLDVPMFNEETGLLPLREIVLGPAAVVETSTEALTQILLSKGYSVGGPDGVKIVPSKTPIRG